MTRHTHDNMWTVWAAPIVALLACSTVVGAMNGTEGSKDSPPRLKAIPAFTLATLAPPYLEHAYFEGHDTYPFQADAASFNLANAWWLAEAATLAYADEAFAGEWFKKAGFDDVRLFERGSTQCFVASSREFAVVAFRGSEIWRRRDGFDARLVADHLMTNADVWLTDWPNGGKVHRGFRKALDDVWGDLFAHLAALQRRGRKIWMTGHSLGAALATLAADRYGYVQGVYTFGSPQVGNRRFTENYVIRTYRFVNGNDIVAQVPPAGFYAHVGDARFIDEKGIIRDTPAERVRALPTNGEEQHGRNASRENDAPSKTPRFLPDAVIDHTPLLYAVLIWNNLVAVRPGKE